jgi:hypothetical protein
MKTALLCALAFSFCTALCGQAALQSSGCGAPLSQQKKLDLVKYVTTKYKLSSSVSVRVASENELNGTCYRELTFEGTSPVNTWHLTL